MQNTTSKGVAVVTGAAQGMGHAIAVRLASDGYDVAINDHKSKEDMLKTLAGHIAEKGRKTSVISGDVSNEATVESMVKDVVAQLGSLDIMIANAGIFKAAPIQDFDSNDLDRMLAVNVKGVAFCLKHAARQMIAQGTGGRILVASSVNGKKGTDGTAIYSSTKFAVRGLMQAAAADLGKHGITVNAYGPGVIRTPMLEQGAADLGTTLDEMMPALRAMSPMGMTGTPEDVAGLVSFLVSSEAKFITGHTYLIDGGMVVD